LSRSLAWSVRARRGDGGGALVLLASTRLGVWIRADRQDLEMARMVGVNPRTVYAVTFGLAPVCRAWPGRSWRCMRREPNMGLTYRSSLSGGRPRGLGYTGGVVWGGLTLASPSALTETYLEAACHCCGVRPALPDPPFHAGGDHGQGPTRIT